MSVENDKQLIISVYFIGFAAGQFLLGPLSDHYGRRLPLLAGLAIYIAGTVLALLSGSFAALLAARIFQGFGASSPRVIALAIVCDRFGDSLLAVANSVTQAPNDKRELEPILSKTNALPQELGKAKIILADKGFFSEANVRACAAAGIEPLIDVNRDSHHRP